MIKRIPGLAQKLWHDFLGSIKRFPEAIIFAVTTVVLLIVMNHWQTSEQTTKLLTRLAMTLAFGFPIALSLNVLFEHNPQRRSKPMIIFSLALVVLAAYFIFFLKEINPVSISRYIAYSLSSYLAFVFIPYLSHRKHFELSVIELLTRFCITFLYSATLFLGLSAILFTVDQLFAMGINSKPYFDLWLIMAGIFAPVFFLAKIPVPALDSEPDSYPKVLKALFLYILIPLLSVYTIILFTYFAKIIITQTWPIGLVSHLVLWYAVFSALLIFCLEPLSKQSRMAEQFSKLLPRFILPLIAMMFVAMGKRIETFGITENRYYVLVAGFWVTSWMLYYCFVKRPHNVLLPVSLAVIALLTVTGPWSSFAVAKYSQNQRFVALLDKFELLEDNSVIPRPNLSGEAKQEISSVIAYFRDNHSLKDINILPDDFTISDMEKIFGFKFTRTHHIGRDGREYFSYQLNDEERILLLEGYEVFVDLSGVDTMQTFNLNGLYEINYSSQTKELVIGKDGNELYRENIAALLGNFLNKQSTALESTRFRRFTDQNDHLELCFLFKHVRGWKESDTGEFEITWVDFYLFVKER